MLNTITVTDAARNFSDVINRIYYQRRSYLLTRGGAVVAKLTPADAPLTGARLAVLWEARPRLDSDDAVGLGGGSRGPQGRSAAAGGWGMGFLIDSNILIAAERGQFSLADLARDVAGESLALSAITASELLHGVHRATDPGIREKRARFVEYVLGLFPILPFDLEIAGVHAELWAAMQQAGQTIGAHDLIIAATARAASYGVITANSAEFQRVPGLRVINPLV